MRTPPAVPCDEVCLLWLVEAQILLGPSWVAGVVLPSMFRRFSLSLVTTSHACTAQRLAEDTKVTRCSSPHLSLGALSPLALCSSHVASPNSYSIPSARERERLCQVPSPSGLWPGNSLGVSWSSHRVLFVSSLRNYYSVLRVVQRLRTIWKYIYFAQFFSYLKQESDPSPYYFTWPSPQS